MADFNDAINDLRMGLSPDGTDAPAAALAPTPFDSALRDLSPSSGPVVVNPGAPQPGGDGTVVTREMKNVGYEAARGLTANLIDKLPASGIQTQARQFEAQHPYTAKAAQFVGSMIPGFAVPEALPLRGLRAGATLAQSMRANALVGGAFGAASGYGDSTDSPVRDTAIGAGMGTAVGVALPVANEWMIKPAMEGLSANVSSGMADTLAFNRVRNRVLQSEQFGGPSFADMRAALDQHPDKPLGLVDVGSESLKGLAGSVARTPGAPNQAANTFFNSRDVSAMGRTLDDIDTHVSAGQDAFTALRAIDAQKAIDSKPLYDLFRGFRPISPDEIAPGGELNSLMQTPAMKAAANNAMTIAANRRVDPKTLGIGFNEAGDPIFEQVPSWQTLQYMKQGLDDVVGTNRNPITGKIVWDNQSRAVNDVLQDFQKFMGDNNPFWKPANDVWSGHAATQNAMEWGQDFKSFTPAQIQYRLGQMGPSEREAALVGLADTLRRDVLKTPASADEAKRLLPKEDGWQYQQIAPFFQDQNTFKQWAARVLSESKMANTKSTVMSGSQTAARGQEDAEGGGGAGAHVAQLATGLAALHAGEPFASMPMIFRGSRGILGALREPNSRVAEHMAPILFNSDYAQNVQNLQRLGLDPSSPWVPNFMPGVAETAAAIPAGILGQRKQQP